MKNWSFSVKLTAAFGACIAIMLMLSGVSLLKLGVMNDAVATFAGNRLPKAVALGELKGAFTGYRLSLYRHIASGPADGQRDRAVADARATLDKGIASLAPMLTAPEAIAALNSVREQLPIVYRNDERVLALSRANQDDAATAMLVETRQQTKAIDADLRALRRIFDAQEDKAKAETAADYTSARWMIALAVLAALGLVAATLAVMVRLVSQPLGALAGTIDRIAAGQLDVALSRDDRRDEIGGLTRSVATLRDQLVAAEAAKEAQATLIVDSVGSGLDALAQGDLTARIDAELTGPFAKLKADFNRAMDAVGQTMVSVTATADNIANGAGDIRQASDDLSQRTEQQAASLEETAAAMHEITETVRETAVGAARANGVVSATREDAEASGSVVRRAVEAMHGIEASSAEISEIIAVIDGIAFQTNLLALNAGVEAARAGDAGKGFAVVASEVRALAQRSADAAKDVKTRITASSEQVELGAALVSQTGEALTRIIARITEISALMSDIASSAEQQSTGLQQVNTAVAEMDGVTQQNAAMVEEATAAARSLSDEAEALKREIRRFRLVEGEASAAASPVHRLQARVAGAGW
ncbi:methyl-accepting chemotaxis protein [Sphingomonas ginsenosidimutans]|uniref:methyl-accepting chemotaxis protein n=1 Tax=Sphingomonas ginsenosidimutans TaxID=862134 RepID=UPI001DF8A0CC|nr:methyl-accepting chemotaxis protein [Sphingomonas ginsenosidimutans]MBY0300859.1 MCP four helix bundle domain-containing protein [Sphingomonas ginsenosidimutans]